MRTTPNLVTLGGDGGCYLCYTAFVQRSEVRMISRMRPLRIASFKAPTCLRQQVKPIAILAKSCQQLRIVGRGVNCVGAWRRGKRRVEAAVSE